MTRPNQELQRLRDAMQRIHDLLYLDVLDGQEVYDPDKSWDVGMLPEIAEIVAEQIPRPEAKTDGPVQPAEAEDEPMAPMVIVTVSGGVAGVLAKPQGVALRIYDYDVEGSDEGQAGVSRDPDGHLCTMAEWTADEARADNTHLHGL